MQNKIYKSGSPLVFYGLIAYTLAAAMWWAVLLYRKTTDLYLTKRSLLELQGKSSEIANLTGKYEKQLQMIFGEGCVFMLLILISIFFLLRTVRKELLVANQQKNFLLSITHELKSPLASIQLVLETFRKRKLNESQTEHLTDNGLQEVQRLSNLVNNLLLAARVETAYELHKETISLHELIKNIADKLSLQYPKHSFEILAPKAVMLNIDRTTMTSVFVNLLDNAAKYSPENTTIEINIGEHKNQIEILVKDNGKGIPNTEKKRVFDKFYRVGKEETRQSKGTGLGLYIVNEIIKLHRGTITISDNQPQGSIFRIQLPKI